MGVAWWSICGSSRLLGKTRTSPRLGCRSLEICAQGLSVGTRPLEIMSFATCKTLREEGFINFNGRITLEIEVIVLPCISCVFWRGVGLTSAQTVATKPVFLFLQNL